MMAAIAGVLETVLYAGDLDAAQRFYGDLLGLPLDSRKDGTVLLLSRRARGCSSCSTPRPRAAIGRSRRTVPSDRDMPALPWPRTSSTTGRLGSRPAGIAIEHEQTWPRGGRSFYVRDPAGNSVEFATPRIWGLPDPAAARDDT